MTTINRFLSLFLGLFFQVVVANNIDLLFVMKEYRERPQLLRAAEMAVESINKKAELLPDSELRINLVDISLNLDNMRNLAETFYQFEENLVGYIGPFSSDVAIDLGAFINALEIPMQSGTCTAPELSNANKYKFFGRTSASGIFYAEALAGQILKAGFKRIALFCLDTSYGLGLTNALKDILEKESVQIIDLVTHPERSTLEDDEEFFRIVDEKLDKLEALGSHVIFYNGYEGTQVLRRAMKKNMLGVQKDGATYQWLLGDAMCKRDNIATVNAQCSSQECEDDLPNLRKAMRGIICANVSIRKDDNWQKMWDSLTGEGQLTEEEIADTGLTSWADSAMYSYCPFFYDSVLTYAEAIHALCLEELPKYGSWSNCYKDLRNQGAGILDKMKEVDFYGASGRVKFLENLDREVVLDLVSYQYSSSTDYDFEIYGTFTPAIQLVSPLQQSMTTFRHITYANLESTPPETMIKAEIPPVFVQFGWISVFFSGIATEFGIFLALKKRNKLHGLVLISFPTLVCLASALMLWFVMLMVSSLMTINPQPEQVALAVWLDFLSVLVISAAASILLSRTYRFYTIATNSKLRAITHSKFHQIYTVIFTISIPVVCTIIRVLPILSDSEKSFSDLSILQNDDMSSYFAIPSCIYEQLVAPPKYVSYAIFTSIAFVFCVCVTVSILARKSCTKPVIQQKPLAYQELQTLSKCSIIFAFILFLSFSFRFAIQKGAFKDSMSDRRGFDNFNESLSARIIITNVKLRIVGVFFCWFTSLIGFQKHYWREFFKKMFKKGTITTNSHISSVPIVLANHMNWTKTGDTAYTLDSSLIHILRQVVDDETYNPNDPDGTTGTNIKTQQQSNEFDSSDDDDENDDSDNIMPSQASTNSFGSATHNHVIKTKKKNRTKNKNYSVNYNNSQHPFHMAMNHSMQSIIQRTQSIAFEWNNTSPCNSVTTVENTTTGIISPKETAAIKHTQNIANKAKTTLASNIIFGKRLKNQLITPLPLSKIPKSGSGSLAMQGRHSSRTVNQPPITTTTSMTHNHSSNRSIHNNNNNTHSAKTTFTTINTDNDMDSNSQHSSCSSGRFSNVSSHSRSGSRPPSVRSVGSFNIGASNTTANGLVITKAGSSQIKSARTLNNSVQGNLGNGNNIDRFYASFGIDSFISTEVSLQSQLKADGDDINSITRVSLPHVNNDMNDPSRMMLPLKQSSGMVLTVNKVPQDFNGDESVETFEKALVCMSQRKLKRTIRRLDDDIAQILRRFDGCRDHVQYIDHTLANLTGYWEILQVRYRRLLSSRVSACVGDLE
eukprot:TRINITY_DN3436_c1_g1_i2.p1 TRINITY_DN3436_c1_g1~~TRINITY_DN3436_c1_g1_i2.p1  ORF type:complete len:1296 (+),score=276.57 TRINITY_DN3436_c1_g1_i2:104-3991(+)